MSNLSEVNSALLEEMREQIKSNARTNAENTNKILTAVNDIKIDLTEQVNNVDKTLRKELVSNTQDTAKEINDVRLESQRQLLETRSEFKDLIFQMQDKNRELIESSLSKTSDVVNDITKRYDDKIESQVIKSRSTFLKSYASAAVAIILAIASVIGISWYNSKVSIEQIDILTTRIERLEDN